MKMTVEQLEQEVARLSEEDQLRLVSRIAGNLGTGMAPEVEQAWADEIKQRIVKLDAGLARTRNVDDVIAGLLADSDVAG